MVVTAALRSTCRNLAEEINGAFGNAGGVGSGGGLAPDRAAATSQYITLDLGRHDVLADPGRRGFATSFALVDGTQQRVPLVHPRAEPEEPAAEARERVEH